MFFQGGLSGSGPGSGSGPASVAASAASAVIASRGEQFVDGFVRSCVDATRANARDASERLRMTTLNAVIKSEASVMSDLPMLERAVTAMRWV